LMENAGLLAALEIERLYHACASAPQAPVIVFCGGGNNGGDGFVIARQLQARDIPVMLEYTHGIDKGRGDARANHLCAQSLRIPMHQVDLSDDSEGHRGRWPDAALFVDALLGTGFEGPMRAPLARLIMAVNGARTESGTPTVAIDLPSGLDCDEGHPAKPTIVADQTLTFVAEKAGFGSSQAHPFLGQVTVLPIGVSAARVLGEDLS
ncbi:MAG: NAD(P)H-hydrate epimerase, partial [bacterium]